MAVEPVTPADPAATVATPPPKPAAPAKASPKMPNSPFLRHATESWSARQELRFRTDPATPTVAPVLEQRWSSTLGGEKWIAVPTVSISAGA